MRTRSSAKTNVATQETTSATSAWLHVADADPGRQKGHQQAALQGQAPTGRLEDAQTSERHIRQTLGRDQRLRSKSDFAALRERGISRAHPLLVLRAVPNSLPYARFGFVVGRRVATKAVDRNRVRRRLREIVRRTPVRSGWDLLLIARHAAVGADFQDLQDAIRDLERRAGLLEQPDGKAGVA